MKFDYKTKLDSLRKVFAHRHSMLPIETVWTWLLSAFIIVNLLVMVWSFFFFLRVSGEDTFGVTPEDGAFAETLSREQLERLLGELELRQVEFENRTQTDAESTGEEQIEGGA